MADSPTLTIPNDVITPLIEAKIRESVLAALGDQSAVMTAALASVLRTKVDHRGVVSQYHSANKTPWIEWAIGDRLKKVLLETITEYLGQHEAQIKRHLRAELAKKNSPLVRQLLNSMAGAIAKTPTYAISVTLKDG